MNLKYKKKNHRLNNMNMMYQLDDKTLFNDLFSHRSEYIYIEENKSEFKPIIDNVFPIIDTK
jgi:hypothetical protein